jgi:hypothetical protein
MYTLKNLTGSLSKISLVAALALALCLATAGSANAQSGAPKPTLNVVSIGISNYQKAPLKSPHKDALDMAKILSAQQGKLFGQVQAQTILNEQATSANIERALRWAASSASANSYTVVFLAGHGTNRTANGEFHYAAYDNLFAWARIQSALQNIPGRVIVILDCCNSGALTGGGDLIVFSSSLAHQISGETDLNGYFTQVLLEGLGGRADSDRNGTVTLAEVDAYVAGRLEVISNGQQSSTLLRPANVPSSLPLALLTAAAATPVANQTGPTFNTVQPVNHSFTGPINPTLAAPQTFEATGPISN